VSEIETNANGGMGSAVPWWEIVDMRALRAIAETFKVGAKRYAINNWRRCPAEEHVRHMFDHGAKYLEPRQQYNMADYDTTTEELAHMATRALMALAVHLQEDTCAENAPAGLAATVGKANGADTDPEDLPTFLTDGTRRLPR